MLTVNEPILSLPGVFYILSPQLPQLLVSNRFMILSISSDFSSLSVIFVLLI